MAAYKYTVQLGKVSEKDVIIAAGSAEAQSQTLSVNIDKTTLSKADAVYLLEAVIKKIHKEKWPPL